MEYRMFYSWQSDSPGRLNRYFIKEAAERALKKINQDATVEDAPRLDSDTAGESGTPDVSGTIFGKLKACDVFLGDVTLVGAIHGHDGVTTKKTPNPNVLLELGYAARCLGWERIVCVMNEAYGSAQELIFHLRNRRFPIGYRLQDGDSKGALREWLSAKIEEAVLSAANAEHQDVTDSLHGLHYPAIELLQRHANDETIECTTPIRMEGYLLSARQEPAIIKLLEAGFIKFAIKESKCVYIWTYRGVMALKRLGYRK